jgi:cobyric acid synthase
VLRADGAVIGAGRDRVWGTYLHGLFDADEFRRWFIDRLRKRKGLPPLGAISLPYDLEPALDRLAAVVRHSIRLEAVYELMGLR